MMQPHLAEKIAEQTKKDFPEGIGSFGTDALRFTFASLASTGRDIRFDLKRVEGYRNFCNKLFNATRYVLMNTEGMDPNDVPEQRNTIDNWMISQLQIAEKSVAEHIENYRFDLAATTLYELLWNEYCDWYWERAKPILTGDTSETEKQSTRVTLVRVLEAILRLAHPIMPYITEELWHQVAPLAGKSGETISLQPYPEADDSKIDQTALADIEWVKESVLGVRKIRAEMNISPGKKLPLSISDANASDTERLDKHGALLTFLARLSDISILQAGAEKPDAAVALVDDMQLLIPMDGLIDKEAELKRLSREIEKLEKLTKSLTGKLGNPGFTNKAPPEVVKAEQQKLDDATAALENLKQQKAKLS